MRTLDGTQIIAGSSVTPFRSRSTIETKIYEDVFKSLIESGMRIIHYDIRLSKYEQGKTDRWCASFWVTCEEAGMFSGEYEGPCTVDSVGRFSAKVIRDLKRGQSLQIKRRQQNHAESVACGN